MGAIHDPFVGRTVPIPMDADTHRQIGAALGFPSCCVEAWLAPSNIPAAIERGGVHLGTRLTRPEGLPDGWCRDYYGNDTLVGTEVCYVPCPEHAGPHTEGWRPWGA